MATWRASTQIFLLFSFLLLTKSNILEAAESNTSSRNIDCIERERKALLEFRKGLKDPSGWLSSWAGKDCCNWTGVYCSNTIGNVVKLDLKSFDVCISAGPSEALNNRICLGGTLNPSLLNLAYLSYLDVSRNNFKGIPIPEFIGSLKNLRYLDLSQACFSGEVPRSLGNLSYLKHLDLSTYLSYDPYPFKLSASDLNWVAGLSSLQYLDLSVVNMSKAARPTWFQAVNMLPSLTRLSLSSCELNDLPKSLTVNFTNLSMLDLSNNNFSSSMPRWLFNISTLEVLNLSTCEFKGSIPEVPRGSLCNLRTLDLSSNAITGEIKGFVETLSGCSNNTLDYLDLSWNDLQGNLPDSLGNLKYLGHLHLSRNSFSGSLPWSIGNLSSLEVLDLSFNSMKGTIPESIGQLTTLYELNLYGNSWEGIITENHFQNLSRLLNFTLSSTSKSLMFNFSQNWVPSFKLIEISVRNCKLGPGFPTWLKTQDFVTQLTLSGAGISDTIPVWFWNLTSTLSWVDLSDNQLRGKLPNSISFINVIDLSGNDLKGEIPDHFTNLSSLFILNLSRNHLSGKIPKNIRNMHSLESLDLSHNNLSGSIPESMVSLSFLTYLNLSFNKLTGPIPTGGQFQTFNDPSIYQGNLELCGPPLLSNCSLLTNEDENRDSEGDDKDEKFWFDLSMGLGFIVGFWVGFYVVCWSLVIKQAWRRAYFKFLDEIKDRIYVFIAVSIARCREKIRG